MGCSDKLLVRKGWHNLVWKGCSGQFVRLVILETEWDKVLAVRGMEVPEAMVAVMGTELVWGWEAVERFLLLEAERERSVLILDRS